MSSSIKKEKGILPSSNLSPTPAPTKSQRRKHIVWVQVAIICFIVFRSTYLYFCHATDKGPSNNCPQADVLMPEKNGEIWTKLNDRIGSATFKQTAIDWLAGAIRIPWASPPLRALSVLINLLINWSKNWIIRFNGSSRSRPSIWSVCFIPRLSTGSVPSRVNNSFSQLFSWDLSTTSKVTPRYSWQRSTHMDFGMNGRAQIPHLNPCFSLHIKVFTTSRTFYWLFLTSLPTDVVPVHPDTVNQWTHPPYSGFFDGSSLSERVHIMLRWIFHQGENIWGRGSVDDKGGLVGILCAVFLSHSPCPKFSSYGMKWLTIAPRLNPSSKPNSNRRDPSYSLLDLMRNLQDSK